MIFYLTYFYYNFKILIFDYVFNYNTYPNKLDVWLIYDHTCFTEVHYNNYKIYKLRSKNEEFLVINIKVSIIFDYHLRSDNKKRTMCLIIAKIYTIYMIAKIYFPQLFLHAYYIHNK